MQAAYSVSGRIIDIHNKEIFEGTVQVENGRISKIVREATTTTNYILPGFVDAHVHVESSMLVPSEFARLAVVHGTIATISDPHEIGNVLGVKGVEYMIENGKKTPFKFYFGAPSCVPATPFETAGAEITAADIEELFKREEIVYLAEMMNWPGVLHRDPVVIEKIELARKYGKAVDGHAPGLMGEQAKLYASAGITTDHECFTAEEALDKLAVGMKILIREGSAAKNFEALIPLLPEHYQNIMFCSDDKHPDNLVEGHINLLVKRALAKGNDLFHVLQAACVNPVEHYKMKVGLLRENDPADFIVVDNLDNFDVLATYINGEIVAENGKSNIAFTESETINNFNTSPKTIDQFRIPAADAHKIRVIEAFDGQLITKEGIVAPKVDNGFIVSDVANDVLKMTVVNRYEEAEPAVAFIKNLGLQSGAIASSVGHDSHNIIAVGVDDESIVRAVNLIISAKGGVSAVDGEKEQLLPLPVAGIMSAEDGYKVAEAYSTIDKMSKDMGSNLASPFMTLSFMALLVIPSLKLSDKGLFNGDTFSFVPVTAS
ncbi:adenine deaminase [Pontibacter sp. BT310]|uniref:Adenine deaminase n=1 Tax=Pontibacter populi TaxID=890055 RepID=A0ABS6XE45_9BACT|nr:MULTISPECIES: adenine deaminase [Pontibacter]MBJ6119402.1 adenine deaminase [Pontibacter sp. BT310]MBR0571830.1 adenine deaminase [Microvirga sp. STS03]MBW3366256.1 adenine deaminase [Pontibacter populi]